MRHSSNSRRAFSLTELVVVIAIIAVLIGILIPVISRVQSAARAADTRQQISRISAAIERYRSDFNAYPGPFSNAQVTPGTVPLTIGATIGVPPTVALTGAAAVTGTENMLVGLIGGLGITVSAPPAATISAFVYDPARLGKGPMNLNPMNPKQYPSYLDYAPDEVKDVGGGSVIPEFIDRFQTEDQPRAILFIRAKTGAPGVVDVTAEVNVKQYNPRHLSPYGLTTYPEAADAANDTTGFVGSYNFFKSPGSAAPPSDTPSQKDGFILLSAGRDRAYGTSDDILSYSR